MGSGNGRDDLCEKSVFAIDRCDEKNDYGNNGYNNDDTTAAFLLVPVAIPLQEVSFPLQDPFSRQTLTEDPLRTNPSSHWKSTLLGYVVSSP